MKDITIVLRGPFTDDEIRRVIEVAREIEEARLDANARVRQQIPAATSPQRQEETFEVFVNAPDMRGEPEEILAQLNPLRPGYSRVVKTWFMRDRYPTKEGS